MLLDQVGVDFIALENRVAELERQMRVDYEVLPPIVQDLKQEVTRFRAKLEKTEHLGWMGYYKELPPPEDCRRLQYRRRSHEEQRRVKEHFLEICDVPPSEEIKDALKTALFDCSPLSDSDILALLEWMYHDFGLPEKFHIDARTIRAFLYEVYKNYNEVPFHNFRHGFCVTQMMYAMACCVDVPAKVGDLETLILITSCICHDLDHPGYNNIYQINARTELALRYNDISPLENHHCSVAFRILELQECNILASLPAHVFRTVREGIIRCILATDMARHNEILAQFKDITPEFDFGNKSHTDLLSMVLIKVADISNEARPMHVAEPWLDRLLQEFFKQSDAEKMEGLPVTPFMDPNKITKPSSQCSFIGFVLLPLFEALGALLPQLHDMIVQPVREALEYYRRLNEQCREERIHRKSIVDLGDLTPAHLAQAAAHGQDTQALVKSGSGYSVKSRKSFQTVRSRSRSAEDEALERPQDVPNTEDAVMEKVREQDEEDVEADPAGHDDDAAADEVGDEEEEDVDEEEEEEEETATEVEVSEKTLKFKISTESGRKSYPGSRKGSRDKSALSGDLAHQELARAVRDLHHHQHHHYHHGSAAPTPPTRSSLATSPQSGRSTEFSRCNGDKDTKCLSFEDDTLSRSSHSPCSGEGSKRGSTAGRGARSPQPPRDTSPLGSPVAPPSDTRATSAAGTQSADARASSSPKLRSPTSFLKKLKNLTDRLSFSVSSDSSSREATSATASAGASPCHGANSPTASVCPGAATCPASPMLHQADGTRARHGSDAVDSLEMRATLPKTRGPRGWRSLLGAEPNPPERRRQASVNASPEADDGLDLAAAAVAEGEPTGNNNNRKKTGNLWSPGSRRGGGLLNRLKQSGDSIHSAGGADADAAGGADGAQGPHGSEGGASGAGRQPGLMASLAASFRPKKPPPGPSGPSGPSGLPPAPTPAPQ
ncbi:high affinity cGMP-specific 3',5'-cyclic phosphodiesterase 9A [Thrips palmi]|uniref:Phosphodiesterase n=1 Tax=Thrips palmi TaxID=161013 RepID=A0A6P8ZL11_THRPL|nr:high affinity cGMP-specific 3',5'-cyclic phosphodiesterase 9A [Thrips palmi]